MAHPGFSVASTTLAGVTSTTTGATGNYGMMDSINNLQWVQQNIGTFGGDSSLVTIVGESAVAYGAGAVMTETEEKELAAIDPEQMVKLDAYSAAPAR